MTSNWCLQTIDGSNYVQSSMFDRSKPKIWCSHSCTKNEVNLNFNSQPKSLRFHLTHACGNWKKLFLKYSIDGPLRKSSIFTGEMDFSMLKIDPKLFILALQTVLFAKILTFTYSKGYWYVLDGQKEEKKSANVRNRTRDLQFMRPTLYGLS